MTLSGGAFCVGGACGGTVVGFPTTTISQLGVPISGLANFSTTAAAIGRNAVAEAVGTIVMWFTPPVPGSIPAYDTDVQTVRCDNALPGPSRPGCVFPLQTPTLSYHFGSEGELAEHISRAQRSGLPGTLTRVTDSVRIAKNRATACRASYRSPGKDCDEYPFASTYEGAASGGGPRTFAGCGISAVPQGATGSKGFSVCMINRGQNQTGGSQLLFFYNNNRVLDKDPFRVSVGPWLGAAAR
jgi:hypothetical protein